MDAGGRKRLKHVFEGTSVIPSVVEGSFVFPNDLEMIPSKNDSIVIIIYNPNDYAITDSFSSVLYSSVPL